MRLEDEIRKVLSDPATLPPQFLDYMVHHSANNAPGVFALRAPVIVSTGTPPGAVAASRYVGATTTGSPASGYYQVGDFVIAQDGHIWICTVAGDPGTWVEAGGGGGGFSTATAFQSSLYLTRNAPGTADSAQTIPSGVATAIAWHGINESGGGSPGGIVAPSFGDTSLVWAEFGIDVITLSVIWPAAAYDRYIEITVTNPLQIGSVSSPRLRASSTPEGDKMTLTAIIDGSPVSPTSVSATVFQSSGSSQDISAEMAFVGTKPDVTLS